MNEKNSSFGFWQEKNVSKWILCAKAYLFSLLVFCKVVIGHDCALCRAKLLQLPQHFAAAYQFFILTL